jgi:hypothetical protein
MPSRLIFSILLAAILPLQATRLGFLPFSNMTKYKGNWFLEKDIPFYLEKALGKTYDLAVSDSIYDYLKAGNLPPFPNLPEHKRRVAKHFNADFLISGDIGKFSVSKRIVGEGKYGGLKTYAAEIKITVKVYSLSQNSVIYDNDILVEKKENNTAVNLGKLSKDEALFDSLNTEKFGSKVFEQSIAGAMMRDLSDKMLTVIQGLPVPVAKKGESKKLIKNAKVVDLNETDVFINAGLDDQVTVGDTYNVFSDGDTIRDPDTKEALGVSEKFLGTIEITEVKASHFSRARITVKKDSLRLMNRVRIEK